MQEKNFQGTDLSAYHRTLSADNRRYSSDYQSFLRIRQPFLIGHHTEENRSDASAKAGADYSAPAITVDNNPLNVPDKFIHEGSTISERATVDGEVSLRIGTARALLGRFTKLFRSECGVRLTTITNTAAWLREVDTILSIFVRNFTYIPLCLMGKQSEC